MIYRELNGYKFELMKYEHTVLKGVFPDTPTNHVWCWINKNNLFVRENYAWDGATGPTWQDSKNKRGSLVHDALYQLMREGHLGFGYRKLADQELIRICKEDGMSGFRAWYYMLAVRTFGSFTVKLSDKPRYKIVDTDVLKAEGVKLFPKKIVDTEENKN